MRSGCRQGPPSKRQVSAGSSARAVPMPTMMAANRCRSRCARSRASGPVIHRDAPVRVAAFPSRVMAYFSTTKGRPVVMKWKNTSLRCRHPSSRTPVSTTVPASRSCAHPWPATKGFGSRAPTTTRAMPASRIASVQGGVLPQWQHGSSVTYRVLPAGSSAHAASASRSAWGWPHAVCQPSPMMRPSFTITAPTSGFGLVQPVPLSASASARAMKASSRASCSNFWDIAHLQRIAATFGLHFRKDERTIAKKTLKPKGSRASNCPMRSAGEHFLSSSIQTVTVGFGISPNQPQAQDLRVVGCTTGGDFHPALKIMFNC